MRRKHYQLAYWTLLSAAVLVVLRYNKKLVALDYIILALGGYIQALALSKAGIITYSLLMFTLLFSQAIKDTHRILAVFGFLILFCIFLAGTLNISDYTNRSEIVHNAVQRIRTIGHERDDSAAARGYRRMAENPLYLVLGAGEGGYERFGEEEVRELHSGLATLLFSYGPVGFCLFGFLLYAVFSGRPVYFTVLLGLILMFGLVHQNIRFSMFWIFLAAVYGSPMTMLRRNAQPSET